MGIFFSSPQLQGAQSYTPGVPYSFSTSYAFAPTDTNAFGITAEVFIAGDQGALTPYITVPAPTSGGSASTYECIPFPSSVRSSSIICPGLMNTAIFPGTVTLSFTSVPFFSGIYAFSVTTPPSTSTATVTTTSTSTVIGLGMPAATETTTMYLATVTSTPSATTTLTGISAVTLDYIFYPDFIFLYTGIIVGNSIYP
ncbi:hypothetical protein MMC24_007929, partial [Lignoscripta atroalba]|nr:hypothetical protein [Lignoscripta atroalba]